MGHVIRGQAAGLVVLLTVHVPVQVGHRNVFFSVLQLPLVYYYYNMVDEDKQACRRLALSGFRGGQWPESYVDS